MNKRGEITTTQIVFWATFIASFMVILFFLGQLFLNTDIIDKEACHTSVLARDLANTKLGQGAKYLSLNCQTEKICIGEDKCEGIFQSTKDSPVTKVKLKTDNELEARDKILEVYSRAILDCHTMLGEGHLNFFPSETFEGDYCVVCSRIALDDSLKDVAPDKIGFLNLYKAMELDVFEGENALERVYGVKTADQISKDYRDLIDKVERGELKDYEGDVEALKSRLENNFADWTFDPSKEQAVIVRITKEGKIFGLIGGSTTAGGVLVVGGMALSSTGVGAVIGVPIALGGVALSAVVGGITYATFFDNDSDYHAPLIMGYNLEELNKIGCDSFENLP